MGRCFDQPSLGLRPGVCRRTAGEGIQDNSFFIEEAYNQEQGVVQHILNVPVLFTNGAREITPIFTQEWPVFSQAHQFSYTIPYTFSEDEHSWADIRLNYRWQALMEGERTPAFTPRFGLVTPTGDADKRFRRDRLGYETNLPLSKIVADRWSIHLNAGGSIFPDVRGHDLINYFLGASVIYAVTKDFNLLLETVAAWEEDVADVAPPLQATANRTTAVLLSPGARYAFNWPNDTQLVVGLGIPLGLTSDSPDWGLFFYFSFEHRFLRVHPK